ncbi:hypothetical protein ACFQJ7_13345 [Halovenus rubra]|uniref:Uncharacterized protein n=2 Tax=Halovenus rubra TaxID=869890 RepID=A0ACC7E0H0_9EURY|nr:hypothetical protein [Halovenus rubra]
MAPRLSVPASGGIVAAIIAAGFLGLWMMDVMGQDTLFTMVLPSMVVFAAITFALGVIAGESRASSL